MDYPSQKPYSLLATEISSILKLADATQAWGKDGIFVPMATANSMISILDNIALKLYEYETNRGVESSPEPG